MTTPGPPITLAPGGSDERPLVHSVEDRHGPHAGCEPGSGGDQPDQEALAQRATRNIAEQDLDSYFEMVEAELNHRRKLYAAERGVITPE
jgi:hypothetical protein